MFSSLSIGWHLSECFCYLCGSVFVCVRYLWPSLFANVVGVQGEQHLPCTDVQNSLVVGKRQHAVVVHAWNAEPRHAVQHIWMKTQRCIITTLMAVSSFFPSTFALPLHTFPDASARPTPLPPPCSMSAILLTLYGWLTHVFTFH